jgi:hypothetical protein
VFTDSPFVFTDPPFVFTDPPFVFADPPLVFTDPQFAVTNFPIQYENHGFSGRTRAKTALLYKHGSIYICFDKS